MIDLLKLTLPARLSSLAGLTAKASPAQADPRRTQQAAILSFSQKVSLSDLEKHLDDYRKGRANLSKATAQKLTGLDTDNAAFLASTGPKLSALYLGYRTSLDYQSAAHYAHDLNDAFRAARTMSEAPNSPPPAEIQRLLDRYGIPPAAEKKADEQIA